MTPDTPNRSLKKAMAKDPLRGEGAKLIRSTSFSANGEFALYKPGPENAISVAALWAAQAEETLSAAETLRAVELRLIRQPNSMPWLPKGALPLMPTAYFLLSIAVEQEVKAFAAKALCAAEPSISLEALINAIGSHNTVSILQKTGFPKEMLKAIEGDLIQCKSWVMDGKYPTAKNGGEIQETLKADHFTASRGTLNIIKAEAGKFLHAITDAGEHKWIRLPL